MAYIIVSNNPLVEENYDNMYFVEGTSRDILIKVRDLLHQGYELISHPLPASIKMFSSPFRSVVVNEERKVALDTLQLEVIENSIMKLERHIKLNGLDKNFRDDYQKLDFLHLASALEESGN